MSWSCDRLFFFVGFWCFMFLGLFFAVEFLNILCAIGMKKRTRTNEKMEVQEKLVRKSQLLPTKK